MKRFACLLTLPLAFALGGCPKDNQDPLTLAEASEALQEASDSSQAGALTSASIDISTNFTIGQAVGDAATELKTFIASQLPCAEVTLSGATLTIDYGVNPGNCTYRGHTFSGSSSVTVSKDDMNQVIVDHTWTNLSNGVVEINGTAEVTWNFSDVTRHITHDVSWTHLKSQRTGHGTGDRTESALPEGIAVGMQIDGTRTWVGQRGEWDLAINAVQMRWADPIPQAGSYVLTTPFNKTITLSFARVDDNTIAATLSGPKRSFTFNVSEAGDATAQ
ncbi:MAG TPA: hypothetical protein VGI10_23380 [Polyangiaceae bacterium]|jgi:hypothetical protein